MLQRAEFFPFSLSGVVLFQRPGSFAIIPYFFLPAGSDFPFFDMETWDWRDLLQKNLFFSVFFRALPFSGIETQRNRELLQKRV